MAIVHVCMDSHNGNEPSATPTVHVAVSTWGLQSVQSFFELVWAPHGIDFVKLISVLAWHGGGSSTRSTRTPNATFGALVEQPESEIVQKFVNFCSYMRSHWLTWSTEKFPDSSAEQNSEYLLKHNLINSYSDIVFDQKIYLNAMGMMEQFYTLTRTIRPGWSHWLDMQKDNDLLHMWSLFARLHRPTCIHLCVCHRSLRTTNRKNHRRSRRRF